VAPFGEPKGLAVPCQTPLSGVRRHRFWFPLPAAEGNSWRGSPVHRSRSNCPVVAVDRKKAVAVVDISRAAEVGSRVVDTRGFAEDRRLAAVQG